MSYCIEVGPWPKGKAAKKGERVEEEKKGGKGWRMRKVGRGKVRA